MPRKRHMRRTLEMRHAVVLQVHLANAVLSALVEQHV
jgi:hypothetical protein